MKVKIKRGKIDVAYSMPFSKKVKWVAIDADGEIYGYTEKPYLKDIKLSGGSGQWLPTNPNDFHEYIGSSTAIEVEDYKKLVFEVSGSPISRKK